MTRRGPSHPTALERWGFGQRVGLGAFWPPPFSCTVTASDGCKLVGLGRGGGGGSRELPKGLSTWSCQWGSGHTFARCSWFKEIWYPFFWKTKQNATAGILNWCRYHIDLLSGLSTWDCSKDRNFISFPDKPSKNKGKMGSHFFKKIIASWNITAAAM